MMKIEPLQQRQMSMVILVAFVIMVTAAVTFYFFQTNDGSAKSSVVATEKPDVPVPTLPAGYKNYTNSTYGFSIDYPQEFDSRESNIVIGAVEKANAREGFEVSFQKPAQDGSSTDYAPLKVRVTTQTLEQAVAGRKAIAAETGPTVIVKSQITGQQSLTIYGYPAVRIDEKDTDPTPGNAKQPDLYTTYVFVNANGSTYALQSTAIQNGSFDLPAAQSMFGTFAIINKK